MIKYLILFFLPAYLSGQKYEATLYFIDGNTKKGVAEIVKNDKKKIYFSENINSKEEKIESEKLSRIEYYDQKTQQPIIYERKEYIERTKKDGTHLTQTAWLKKIYTGTISMYVIEIHYYTHTGIMSMPSNLTQYFFQYKNEMPVFVYDDLPLLYNKRKITRLRIEPFFKDICPDLIRAFDNKTLEIDNNAMPMINYFEENCNK